MTEQRQIPAAVRNTAPSELGALPYWVAQASAAADQTPHRGASGHQCL